MAESKPAAKKPAAKKPAVLVAKESFVAAGRDVIRGQLVSADDPVVKGREHLFESPEAHVEAATAAPGEVRG